MSRVVVRLLVSVACMPMVLAACVVFVILVDELNLLRDETSAVLVCSLGPIVCIAAWMAVWWRLIRWTPRRRRLAILIVGATVASQAMVYVMFEMQLVLRRNWEPFAALFNLLIGLASFIASVWTWTESTRERVERIRSAQTDARACPACGYDMSGLSNLTCPECGTASTLAQINEEHRRRLAPVDL